MFATLKDRDIDRTQELITMSSNRNWKQKLEEIEAEINRATTSSSQQSTTETVRPRIEIAPSPQLKNWLKSGRDWFEALPQVGKVAVGIGALWLSFSVITAFLHIISSLISIAVMGFLLYVGYKFVFSSSNSH